MTDSLLLLDVRYARLADALKPLESVVVAYSGGVDSALVVKAAAQVLGDKNVLAATGQSASLAPREQTAGHEVLRTIDLVHRHRIIPTGEQEIAEYRQNQPDRCFHCKTELYTHLIELARREGYKHVANGANLDDLGDFRPGMDAARNFGIKSPLVDAMLTKQDVRDLARALGLPNWDKPAAPCLASRVPHGQEVNPGKLLQIAQAEAYLEDQGLSGFRVRHHGELARIELGPDAWEFFASDERRKQVERAFLDFGFRFVAVDLGGYRQGKAVIR